MLRHGNINATALAFAGLGVDLSAAERFVQPLAPWLLALCAATFSPPSGERALPGHGEPHGVAPAFAGLGFDLSAAEHFAQTLTHWLRPLYAAAPDGPWGQGFVFAPHETLFMTGCLARGP